MCGTEATSSFVPTHAATDADVTSSSPNRRISQRVAASRSCGAAGGGRVATLGARRRQRLDHCRRRWVARRPDGTVDHPAFVRLGQLGQPGQAVVGIGRQRGTSRPRGTPRSAPCPRRRAPPPASPTPHRRAGRSPRPRGGSRPTRRPGSRAPRARPHGPSRGGGHRAHASSSSIPSPVQRRDHDRARQARGRATWLPRGLCPPCSRPPVRARRTPRSARAPRGPPPSALRRSALTRRRRGRRDRPGRDELERRAEGLDELVRQLADEADRVGTQHRLTAGQGS